MKAILIVFSFAITSLQAFSQNKAALTKDETLNYIQKKLSEAVGLTYNEKDDKITVVKNDISFEGEKIKIHYEYGKLYNAAKRTSQPECSPSYDVIIIVDQLISPTLITESFIEMGKENKATGYIQCNLSSAGNRYKADLKKCRGYSWDVSNWIPQIQSSNFTVNYSKEDPTNFKKLKNALEHLRDLCKAEDDPFAN
jgi:hypothetical protein